MVTNPDGRLGTLDFTIIIVLRFRGGPIIRRRHVDVAEGDQPEQPLRTKTAGRQGPFFLLDLRDQTQLEQEFLG